ncbi:MAG: response regulator [Actinomycetota bacterium]|nr:response regulator [Actinomycetota bacterium]
MATDVLEPATALVHRGVPRDRTDAPVLVLSDDPADLRLLKRFLKRAGYGTVATAADARLAMRTHLDLAPHIVVVDLGMQDPDGFEVMERLRSGTPPDAYPPLFVMTGDMSAHTREEALAAGARGLLAKPLDYSEVVACMENLREIRALHVDLSDIAHAIGNFMSVIRNYADFVVSGLDQSTQREESGWWEIRRDAEEIRLAAERSSAFASQVLALRMDEGLGIRRFKGTVNGR